MKSVELVKKCVFRRRLNMCTLSTDLTDSGMEFKMIDWSSN